MSICPELSDTAPAPASTNQKLSRLRDFSAMALYVQNQQAENKTMRRVSRSHVFRQSVQKPPIDMIIRKRRHCQEPFNSEFTAESISYSSD